jgi:hypothetical protein
MKVRCINRTALSLRPYELEPITKKDVFGRFGVSEMTEYEIEINKEYLVMGLIIFKTYQAYLIDENEFIATYPCQLFELTDSKLNNDWHYRITGIDEEIYPFVQAIFGYSELCNDKKAYQNLLIEMDADAQKIYFKRKAEFEKEIISV